MKTGIKSLLLILMLVCFSNTSRAQLIDTTFISPTYMLVAKQVSLTATVLEFDIFLKHTNDSLTPFGYAGGQYFFRITQAFRNGGTLTYRYATGPTGDTISDLPLTMRPRTPQTVNNADSTTVLRLAVNTFPGWAAAFPISDTAHSGMGTRIIRMRLTNTAPFGAPPGNSTKWHNSGAPLPFTKIFAYTGLENQVNTEVTDTTDHFIDMLTEITPGTFSGVIIPNEFSLSQNYPNPFNPSTKIQYALPIDGKVSIKIYDVTGREVKNLVNEIKTAGVYSVQFNAANLASGMYFYRINIEGAENKNFSDTKKMLLLK